MRAAILMAGLCLGLCLTASPAGAHRVNIFAFVDGDAVAVECGYNRSQKVRQGTVEVFDAESGEKLLQGLTDDKGVFRFPLSDAMLRAGHALRLRIIAGEGHQNEWIVEADELAAAGEARPSPGASPVAEPSAPASASASPEGPSRFPRLPRCLAGRRAGPRRRTSSVSSTPRWTPSSRPSSACSGNRWKPGRPCGTSSEG
ncbi:MAG: hypothetical protein V8Q84_04540 [Bilophila sp.]